jgi:CO/xanthine dehydrogenase FAD-binding subunit
MKPSTTATSVSNHSRVKTEKTRPPRMTRSAGSSPRATASRRERGEGIGREPYSSAVDVLTPRSLDEALRLKAEHPDAWVIQGGTDVMVGLNFDRLRPAALLNLNEVAELRGWSRDGDELRLGSGLTYAEAMRPELATLLPALAEASRTVGSPQIRNRGTIGGNLGTSSPAGDALPPLLVEGADVECASVRGTRRVPLGEFVTGVKQNVLAKDELISAVWVTPSRAPQTFMKVGPRNAMVIAVVSLCVSAGDELRASFGSASPRPVLVTVAEAASPIDDVRGTATYRRHALRVLTKRALERTMA